MNLSLIRTLYDYNYWAHRRVWSCIDRLTDEAFTRQLGYSWGSIRAQVVHVMSAEWMWFSRLRGTSPTAMLAEADFPTRVDVLSRWYTVEQEVYAYLDTLNDADLHEPFEYRTTEGKPYREPRWHTLMHVINHGTDHRAQILSMLHQLGAPTIEQDLIFYLRDLK